MTKVTRGIGRTVAVLFVMLIGLALLAGPAHAQERGGPVVQEAAAALTGGNPVYVDPAVSDVISQETLDEVRREVGAASRPVYAAVLPDTAEAEVSNPRELPEALRNAEGTDGVYVVLTSGSSSNGIYVGASGGAEATNLAREIAESAQAAGREGGPDAALLSAVRGAAEGQPVNTESGVSGVAAAVMVGVVLLVVALGGGLLLVGLRRSRQRKAQELDEVKRVAEEDVTRLGEDIAALDLDVDAPHVDELTRTDYRHALESYDQAKVALDRARSTEDLAAVTTALEDGRYAMTSVRSRLAGQLPPERRPPCFFNPQHGPSVEDVPWAPPGGAPRPVPACAADAERVRMGMMPETRQIYAGGEWRPYYDAGPAYAPWARGYYRGYGYGYGYGYGGDMLSGLLVGTLLGSALGGGWGWGGGYGGDGGGGGDLGGGGGFDFGGGGGDFGGGGGDF